MTATDDRSAAARTPEWVRCERCAALIYGKRFRRTLGVCPECGRHSPLTAPQRLEHLLDPGSASPIDETEPVRDPLGFVDVRPYPDRLAAARTDTGLREAAIGARGRIAGRPVVAAVMDFRFLGGSLGCEVGALITEAARTSLRERVPLLIVTASGGARMQEGVLSLMQMAKTAQALAELDEAGVLTVSLVTDPTYGGVAASFATLTDVILAEPGARMGFAGPRVIEQTTGERLPEGFQTAEFLLAHGLLDDVVPRSALRTTLGRLLSLPRSHGTAPGGGQVPGGGEEPRVAKAAASEAAPVAGAAGPAVLRRVEEVPDCESWDAVRLARHPDRPGTLDYVSHLLEDFHELHGDRIGTDCTAIVGGPGRLGDRTVMLIGHHKGGPDLAERQRRNFGMPTPGGYRKAARLMLMAAKLRLPVVTLIDTPGAYPGPEAERGGQAVAIAESLRLMSRLPVPVVTVLTGEGGSGGALALAVADRVLVSAHGVYSVISPEGCAAILWKDPQAAPRAAAALRVHARELLRLGVVDGVVAEPPGGAHLDHAAAAQLLGAAVTAALDELEPWGTDRLLDARRRRFHRFGAADPAPAPHGAS
ncbi:acetyl-CoA carboxylase, carboxyltransferase subunit beta [Streptomyces sp. XD-27]|uniref:acetyl-CoA carboxylase, carboxyltransferase subunit beta n=1 Tax=Streptomyces sp. XD-27 TaxID=3062779 RepID=UPI0026F41F3A|nr:acetyl-CoA carboxylase, carboxyltransferase subunit beta [Streptomyces sp. XD-27]WKX73258.1 acetyl-CoA carboxylase, carboxyltransferase subunit beta [Streptomyces sp. XD-27]